MHSQVLKVQLNKVGLFCFIFYDHIGVVTDSVKGTVATDKWVKLITHVGFKGVNGPSLGLILHSELKRLGSIGTHIDLR